MFGTVRTFLFGYGLMFQLTRVKRLYAFVNGRPPENKVHHHHR